MTPLLCTFLQSCEYSEAVAVIFILRLSAIYCQDLSFNSLDLVLLLFMANLMMLGLGPAPATSNNFVQRHILAPLHKYPKQTGFKVP